MIDGSTFSNLYEYCNQMSNIDNTILYNLYRETHLKTLAPRMASGPVQGRFLSLISTLKSPKHILEIGTFTGYATICLAEGLASNGHITTIEINPELAYISDKYFKLANIRAQVTSINGNALKKIPALTDKFDIVFIDAKKTDYSAYFELVIDKTNTGGLIIADNVLWDGKVLENSQKPTTIALQKFNQKVKQDPRVSTLLLPLRDGLTILRKL
ncbi:MAG: O-methyltransferase [Saprospiraceae bacterium]